jgi:hypothetical protein
MKGVEAIKASGGITFAQDGSAQHWSIPQGEVSAHRLCHVAAGDCF